MKNFFEDAVAKVQKMNIKNIPDETLLDLYGLYKQSLFGDITGPKPNYFFIKTKEAYKWEAWNICKGMSKDEAMFEYVELVKQLNNLKK